MGTHQTLLQHKSLVCLLCYTNDREEAVVFANADLGN